MKGACRRGKLFYRSATHRKRHARHVCPSWLFLAVLLLFTARCRKSNKFYHPIGGLRLALDQLAKDYVCEERIAIQTQRSLSKLPSEVPSDCLFG